MKRIVLSLLITVFTIYIPLSINAQLIGANFDWVAQMGGTSFEYGQSITTDINGNIYTVGYFTGTTDFDPGAGVNNLTPFGSTGGSGMADVFVQKLDANGNSIWVMQIGGVATDFGNSICTDIQGNVYVTGQFTFSADFDPSSSVSNLTAVGDNDIYILKLNTNGAFQWVKQIGGLGYDQSTSITTDLSGNVYTTGSFSGTVDFDPNAGVFSETAIDTSDVFIHKMNTNGQFQWVKTFGGSSIDVGQEIEVDASGNIYTVGNFGSQVDFDPGAGVFNLSSNGGTDMFVLKLNALGDFEWAKQMGGSNDDFIHAIKVDQNQNIVLTGLYEATVDFDPNAGTAMFTSNGNDDFFIQKLDSNGNLVFIKSIGDVHNDLGQEVAIDTAGSIYVTGCFRGTVDFDPGTGVDNITAGNVSAFMQKLDATGNHVWAKALVGGAETFGNSIAVDDQLNIYSLGAFGAFVDFDFGAGIQTKTAIGNWDVFVLKHKQCAEYGIDIVTACDSFLWIDNNVYYSDTNAVVFTIDGGASNGCDSIVTLNLTIESPTFGVDVVSACNSYTWMDGVTYTSSNNSASFIVPNSVGCDSIISLDLTILQSTSSMVSASSCDTYTWSQNGATYSNSGVYYDTLMNSLGCDSIISLNLSIQNNDSNLQVAVCDSFLWSATGITYFTSGVYIDTLVNSFGCDSVVMLDLTIGSTSGVQNEIACDSFFWSLNGVTYTSSGTYFDTIPNGSGCDSIITLSLILNQSSSDTVSVIACEAYQWDVNGVIYSNSGLYSETFTNSSGCDSIITLDLTITPLPDVSTTTDGVKITSNNTTATSHQWIDCTTNQSISGETGISFTPTQNGSYAVEITENGCVDTSDCVQVTNVGINDESFNSEISVYPNPTHGQLTIDLGQFYDQIKASLISIDGRFIQKFEYENQSVLDIQFDAPKGVYFLELVSNQKEKMVIRVLKQ